MEVRLFHDLSIQQLQAGFWQGIDGFFLATFWYIRKNRVYDFVKDIALKGGLKKTLGISDSVIYIHGSDRPLEPKEGEKFRVFIRPAVLNLQEAACFNPDVIQLLDLPLDDKDDENRVCEKLAINRDIVEMCNAWLIKNGFRSSGRYKNGIYKTSKFMLLGVAHGDMPDIYAEEARYLMNFCEVIGVPVAGLLTRAKGVSMTKRYDYVAHVVEKVLEVVGGSRPVQLMGFGMSRVSEMSRILSLGRKYDATLWTESSTMIRNSTHARKLLSVNIKSPEGPEYVNVARVKGADRLTPLEVFRENNRVMKSILNQAVLLNG